MRFLSQWVGRNDDKTWPRGWVGAERSRRRGRPLLVEALEPRRLLSLTLTVAGQAAGFGLSTFATGFPEQPDGVGPIGPMGIAFPTTGGVLVSDASGNLRLFPTDTDGQNAASIAPKNFGPGNAVGLAQLNGTIYMAQNNPGDVVQLINNGASTRAIVSGIPVATAVLADPFNNLLYVDKSIGGAPIYAVNPVAKTMNVFQNVGADGLALSPDGKTLYAASGGHVLGFDIVTKAMVFDSGAISGAPDGVALGTGPVAGNLFVNTNGGTIVEVNLATAAQALIASGGSRGDFVTVDPNNGTLLVTQSDRIMRLVPGVFAIPRLTTTTTLDVAPQTSTSGQTVTLTAVVATAGTGIPTGTVSFTIDGQAQAPVGLIEVGGFDQATLTTSTLMPGTDTITAAYSGDTTFASSGSNPVTVTIIPGRPTGPTAPTRTVLTAQPRPADLGRPVTLAAKVKDLKRGGSAPSGSVTFLDGTAILGTVALRHGKASFKTSSLPLGPNTIQAYYIPGQGFARSTASVVENVRAHRSRSKAAPSVEIETSVPADDFDSGEEPTRMSHNRIPDLAPSV
jgi:Big-like domain-containing protein